METQQVYRSSLCTVLLNFTIVLLVSLDFPFGFLYRIFHKRTHMNYEVHIFFFYLFCLLCFVCSCFLCFVLFVLAFCALFCFCFCLSFCFFLFLYCFLHKGYAITNQLTTCAFILWRARVAQ